MLCHVKERLLTKLSQATCPGLASADTTSAQLKRDTAIFNRSTGEACAMPFKAINRLIVELSSESTCMVI